MKKPFLYIAISLMSLFILAGCEENKPSADLTEKPTDAKEVTLEDEENEASEPEEKPDNSLSVDLSSESGIRSFVAGKWTLLNRNTGEDYGILSIEPDGSLEFTRLSDTATCTGTLSFEYMQSQNGEEPDWFNLHLEDCLNLVTDREQLYGDEGTSGTFHIGTLGDEDYLYLKEISNGDSVVSMFVFNTNDGSDEIGDWPRDWLFYRKKDGQNKAEAVKDNTFHAWAWKIDDDGDGVWLQPMKEHEYETYEDYTNRKFLAGYFSETDDIGIACYGLNDKSDLSDLVNTADWNSGYPLMMCEVTIDNNGNVKELRDIDIAMYSEYDVGDLDPDFSFEGTIFTINGVDIDMREYVAATDRIIDCMRVGDWIIVECHVNPYRSVYEFYNIPNGDIGFFEYEITGTGLTWRGDDISTAVYVCDNVIYDFWGNPIGYVYDGEIGRIDITDDTTVSAQIRVTDDIGRLKEYEEKYEYDPCDSAVLSYYEYILGGPQQWRRLKEKAGDATALIIVNPPEKMLDKMPYSTTFEEGALDKVVVIPMVDDATITISSTSEDSFSTEHKQEKIEDIQKGRAVVFDVTVPEGMPTASITVEAVGHNEARWDVWQMSGKSPQKSVFIN